jgi:hypothetical protein
MISTSAAYQTAAATWGSKTPIVLITIAGYSRVLTQYATGVTGHYDWIESIEDLSVNVAGSDLDGGADQAQLVFTVQDRGRAITADMPGFVFEGKQVTLKTGFPGMAPVPYTRIQSTGGGSTLKYYYDAGVSLLGVSYRISAIVKNQGAAAVTVATNFFGATTVIPPGSGFQIVTMLVTGDGATDVQLRFETNASGDSLDVLAYDPVIAKVSDGINLVPLARRDFSSWNTFSGAAMTLTQLPEDFATLFTGSIDHVDLANSGLSYVFNCVDNKELLNEVVFQTGDDGQPTDNDHPHTLNAHPLDIVMSIFDTVGATYDATSIASYRDNVFGGLQFSFVLTGAPTAKDFIEQELLKPLGGYLWTDNLGKFHVNFFFHLSSAAVQTLVADDTVAIPDATQAELINVVTVRFDKGGGSVSAASTRDNNSDKFMAEDTESFGPSVAKFGQFGQHIIESQGMRSALQGYSQAKLLARWYFLRYGMKTQQLTDCEFAWTAAMLELGDIVAYTNPFIPDRTAGVVGITSKLFEVLNRTWRFSNYTVTMTLLDASYLASSFGGTGFTGPALIAPDAEADYAAASSADKAKYLFLCNNSDQYSTGAAGRGLG